MMQKRKCISTLHLGSNKGDRKHYLNTAITLIDRNIGSVIKKSSIYETVAWGNTDQADFLNLALDTETSLTPLQLLKTIHEIENTMGRVRNEKWGSRIIDIDIIFYGYEIINSKELIIPHPHLEKRNFVLKPVNDIKSDFIHPIFKKSIVHLLKDSNDNSSVRLWEGKLKPKNVE